ncbi:cytochrome c6 [bacterium BMS3Abin02]|nr:cytochrome c6 [bacterium BMS3Abin02]
MQPSEPIGHELISDLEHYDTKVLIDKINSSLGDNGAEGMMIGGIMRRTRLFAVLFVFTLVAAACSSTAQTTTTTTTPVQTTTTTKAATTTTATTTTATKVAQGDVVKGGLLYDKWWKVLSIDEPTGDMPLWANQSTNTRSGAATWRCKECHGWDYKGADGVYASGSHATGFPGIWDAQSKSYDDLKTVLTTGDHDFSVMGDAALEDLITFIQQGLVDTSKYINADKTLIGADLERGDELFDGTCSACHGADGTMINFGSDEEPEFVGTVASDNPWEALHKIRVGQPGTPMPAALNSGWTLQDMIDVVAHAQTLPTEKGGEDLSAISLGGRLYDKWFKVVGVDAPDGDMPLWANQSTNTRSGAATWRCKECHGWDYKGADGVYASGSHATGFPGIWDARDWTSEQIVAQLSGKNDPNHDFSAYLGHDELHALALFITDGMFDMSTLFDPNTKTPTAGDATEGEELYGTGCAACHGADGTQINFGDDAEPEYVGTVMVDNPWEGSHKIMFGQPGTGMPTGVETGLSIDELLDLIMYMQTFPTS